MYVYVCSGHTEFKVSYHACPNSPTPLTALIADPSIDCIYNPLPNGLHYAPTLAALKAGKHVLLEKPSVSNAQEACSLFRHSILQATHAPVLLEASHYRFHPAWHLFLSQFDKEQIEHAEARAAIPTGLFPGTDIRYDYNLAGGCAMDLGHYTLSALRNVFGTEPVQVVSATPRLIPQPFDQRCDQAMEATYTFPNGGTGHIYADLGAKGGYPLPWLTSNWPSFRDSVSNVRVQLRSSELGADDDCDMTRVQRKTLIMWNFMGPHAWHRIDVETVTLWKKRGTDEIVRQTKNVDKLKAYTWGQVGQGQAKGKGEEWWPTYRYMLEEFVNRVKGREGSGAWVEKEESIAQMVATDATYEKAGLQVRPSSEGVE